MSSVTTKLAQLAKSPFCEFCKFFWHSRLFAAWKVWAGDNGQKAGTAQTFGHNLRAVIPGLRVMRPRDGEERIRTYSGVKLS